MYQVNAVNDELIKEGQQNIRSYFQKKGYFDAKVDVKVDNAPTGTSIVYDIQKDGRFKVKQVAFKGNHHFSNKELQCRVSVRRRRTVLARQVQRPAGARQRQESHRHLSSGRLQRGSVVPNVARNNGNVNIIFQVTEGPLNTVHALTIQGNNTLPESQFAPHGLNLGPGKPYSQDLVRRTAPRSWRVI